MFRFSYFIFLQTSLQKNYNYLIFACQIMQSWNLYFLCFLFEFKKLETYSSALKSPLLRIDAKTSLNVNFFQPDSTFIVYAGVGRKSLQRHPGQTFVWQIALVGTTIAIDGRVGWKKEERRKTKNDTQNKKKREYARAISGIVVACVYLWQRELETTRQRG